MKMKPVLHLLTLSLLLFSAACDKKKTSGETSKVHSKRLVFCSEGSPSSFNPQVYSDGAAQAAVGEQVFNSLMGFTPGTTQLVPMLAKSYSISPNELEYTFQLRTDVAFHSTSFFTPTRNLNADDVLFSFNRQRLKDHPYYPVSGGMYEYFESMDMNNIIKDIQKIDDYTVKFILNAPEAPFLANLGMPFASIVSAEYADLLLQQNKSQDFDQIPVGTGPFKFVSYTKDAIIRYTAHEKYFLGKTPLDELIVAITPDASVRTQKLLAGECHLISYPAPQDFAKIEASSDHTLISQEGLNVGYFAFNVEKKPFDNPAIRHALAMALNRQAYIDAVFDGKAVVAHNPLPPTIWGYHPNLPKINYDPIKAKEVLQSGYPGKMQLELWAIPVSRPYNPNGKKLAEMMQYDLAQVGVSTTIVTLDWPTYLARTRQGEHQSGQFGWTGDNGDPDNFLHILLGCSAVKGGSNLSRWCHKEFDETITLAKRTSDTAKRTALYLKAQEIFARELPFVPLAHSLDYRAMSKRVKGYKINPFGSDNFYGVDLE